MEDQETNPSEVVEEPTEESIEEISEETVEDQAEEAVDEAEDSEDEEAEEEESESADDKMIKLKAVKACNLGKIDRNGPTIHFTEGETKDVKYDEAHKRVVDNYVEGGFLKIVKK